MTADIKNRAGERTEKGKARELILEAAEKVFGEAGIKGATTREIARVAGVNETTLFRNFPNKMALLLAMVEQHDAKARQVTFSLKWSQDLSKDLKSYAEQYLQYLTEHRALILAFISEAGRMPEETRQILSAATQPFTKALIDYFDAAGQAETVRSGLSSVQVAHAFQGVIFSQVVRTNLLDVPYEPDEYLDATVELFIQGLRPNA